MRIMTLSDYVDLEQGNEEMLKRAIATKGPVWRFSIYV